MSEKMFENKEEEEERIKKQFEDHQKTSLFELLFKSPISVIKKKPLYSFLFTAPMGIIFALIGSFFFVPQNFWLIDDIILFSILIVITPPGILTYVRNRKIKKIESEFPDFLRDVAESNSSGMTLTKAVQTAAQGSYGPLTPQITKMNDQISWGISFNEALKRFSNRIKTPLIKRAVSLITEAERAGGDVTEILNAASTDAREIKKLESERKANMAMYVVIIYVSFFVFLAVILILYNSFIPVMARASSASAGGATGGLIAGDFNPELYKRVFFHASTIQGFASGLVAGKMGEGRLDAGLKHSFVLSIISYLIFFFI
ncbi:secretion system protein [archaeon SCG-AAA382B04]|nr:secretion system protein [archaeon SCG-AAA382B04]